MFNFDSYQNVNNINCTYIDSLDDISIPNNNLSTFQININSINAHLNDLRALLKSEK